jgi:hypothetical protein
MLLRDYIFPLVLKRAVMSPKKSFIGTSFTGEPFFKRSLPDYATLLL